MEASGSIWSFLQSQSVRLQFFLFSFLSLRARHFIPSFFTFVKSLNLFHSPNTGSFIGYRQISRRNDDYYSGIFSIIRQNVMRFTTSNMQIKLKIILRI